MEVIAFAKLNLKVPNLGEDGSAGQNKWLPHFNTRDYEGEWVVLPLRSPGGRIDTSIPDLMGNNEYIDTIHMKDFPAVKQLLDTLQCPVLSARFLNLKAGAVIKEHRDAELAFERGEVRLHFPVQTNDQVEFYVNDIRLNMQPGECWYINANLPHRVNNFGKTDRIHLVIDCKVNDWLTAIFTDAQKHLVKLEVNVAERRQIIEILRFQNTETSLKLADDIEQKLMAEINNYEQ
jgi:mannose-6-phosphate isomerase-like protein (cupin superfamily)